MRVDILLGIFASSLLLLACGPLGPLPGSRLDGELSSSLPSDWTFTDRYDRIQIEVRPAEPYSVNVWCVASGDRLYVAAGAAESSVWARALLDDPHARLRIGQLLYGVTATRVVDAAEIEAYVIALSDKYAISIADLSNFQPSSGEPPSAILFRLDAPH
jgi:hypothetical protein